VTTATSKLIKRAIESLASEITQSEIARKAGFDRPNMLSMIKHGKARLPWTGFLHSRRLSGSTLACFSEPLSLTIGPSMNEPFVRFSAMC